MRVAVTLVLALAVAGEGKTLASTAGLFPEGYPQEFSDARCAARLAQVLSGWKTQPDWYLTVSPLDGYRVYRAPTDRAGSWVEVALYPDRSARVARLSWSTRTEVSYSADGGCQPEVAAKVLPGARRIPATEWSDENIHNAIQDSKGTLIYAWSPHMPYSVVGLERVRHTAARLGLRFLPVLDVSAKQGDVDRLVADGKVQASATRRMFALDLSMRGMDVHFPSLVLARSGRIVGHMLPGLKSEADYESFAARELEASR